MFSTLRSWPARRWVAAVLLVPVLAAVLTVLGAVLVLRDAGPALTGPALAAALTLFGLGQRVSQPAVACPTPAPAVASRRLRRSPRRRPAAPRPGGDRPGR